MRRGNLFVISGPSGAGKGTLVARLLREVPDCWVSVSATTRSPREGEQEAVQYFFKSDEEFDALVQRGRAFGMGHVCGSSLRHAEKRRAGAYRPR